MPRLHKPTNPHLHPSFPPVPSDLNKGGVFLFPSKPILSAFCPHHPRMPTLLTILLFLCVSSSQHESPRPRPHSPPVDHLYLAFRHKLLERVARHQYSVSSSSATSFSLLGRFWTSTHTALLRLTLQGYYFNAHFQPSFYSPVSLLSTSPSFLSYN